MGIVLAFVQKATFIVGKSSNTVTANWLKCAPNRFSTVALRELTALCRLLASLGVGPGKEEKHWREENGKGMEGERKVWEGLME